MSVNVTKIIGSLTVIYKIYKHHNNYVWIVQCNIYEVAAYVLVLFFNRFK